jgi:hypothetical protein
MEFLTLAEVRGLAAEIRASFDVLMDNRSLAAKKDAAQWRYFRMCLERTLDAPAEALVLKPLQIAQCELPSGYRAPTAAKDNRAVGGDR